MGKSIEEMKEELESWLCHPSELGQKPKKIEHTMDFVDPDGIECSIFKFRKNLFSKYMLGIVSDSGVFSEFKGYQKTTEVEDAQEILEMLKAYWRDLAIKMQEQQS